MVRIGAIALALCAVFATASAQNGQAIDCAKALDAAKVFAAAATAAKTTTAAIVNVAVKAEAEAKALAQSAAVALSDVKVKANVAQVNSQCISGTATSAVESVAAAIGVAEASARSAASAFANAWAEAKAGSIAQAKAHALSCGCEAQVDSYITAADAAMSDVQSSADQYTKAVASAEDYKHKTALVLVEVSSEAVAVAKPQCASCGHVSSSGGGSSGTPATPKPSSGGPAPAGPSGPVASPTGSKPTGPTPTGPKPTGPAPSGTTKKSGESTKPIHKGWGNWNKDPWGTKGNGVGQAGGNGGSIGFGGWH